RLQAFIANARSHANDPDFQFLLQILSRPDWNGILVLNCTVPVDNLPPQLQGLAAGVDPGQFYAHHLGFTITPVTDSGGQLIQGDTSVFGLINYEDPGDLFDNGSDYQFKVLFLKVLFENS